MQASPESIETDSPHVHAEGARRLCILGLLLPPLAVASLAISWFIADGTGAPDRWMWTSKTAVGLAEGLAFAYLAVTLLRLRSRSAARTTLSVLLAVALAVSGVGMLAINGVAAYGLFGQRGQGPLAGVVEDAAMGSGFVAARFLESGDSGDLTRISWRSLDGTTVDIALDWKRNGEGILVTATPTGTIPEGQDGRAASVQALRNGMVGVPAEYFFQKAKAIEKQFLGVIMAPWYQFAGDISKTIVTPVVDWAGRHGGVLPDKSEGQKLLSGIAGKHVMNWVDKEESMKFNLAIDTLAYERGTVDGIFETSVGWTAGFKGDKSPMTVRGTLVLTASSSGLVGISQEDRSDPAGPGRQLMEQVMKALDEARRPQQDTDPTTAGSSPGEPGSKKIASP
ncbi:MAG: hypothetical protein GY895_05785 [Phycisphaera sp.]|nr:hypothetical protein [Phycisphaera sp.]